MKKIILSLILLSSIVFLNSCSGYKPIFASGNIELEISSYSIEGEQALGKKIYNDLNNLLKSKNNKDLKKVDFFINVSKTKNPTVKDDTGKIKEYKITLNTLIKIIDQKNNNQIVNRNFEVSSTYKIQDNYSDTIRQENTTIENLVNNTYQELLISLSKI
tara:strand:- start:3890 stop:4369 length:480 start_codon:yes stop_codon:yes gene_type:complete